MSLIEDAEHMILYGPEPSEPVKYIPYYGVPRIIRVLVRREPVQASEKLGTAGPKSTQIQHVVVAINDPAKGVSVPYKGIDTIELKKWAWDAAATTFVVSEILSQRGGLYKLQVVG